MTRRSILEYAQAIRVRYLRGSKKTKTMILNEFVAATGLHRKAAIRLLNRKSRPPGAKRSGRPRLYGTPVITALKMAWEAADRLCSRRLHPFLPEMLSILRRKGVITFTDNIFRQLCHMSPSTIDRLLRQW